MRDVYFISGIGADKRLFKYIQLPEGFRMKFIEWISPNAGEMIPGYAIRLTQQMDTSKPFVLVGMSLGGIMSVEIAKRFPPVATIIIGSVPVAAQMPRYYGVARALRLASLLPASFFKATVMIKRLFTKEKKEDKQLIRQVTKDGDPLFIKWALDAVLQWNNEEIPEPLWHIHGTRDEVFPWWLTRPSHTIQKGGHMLVMTHAEEINEILRDILLQL